jgi:hypothetical protein
MAMDRDEIFRLERFRKVDFPVVWPRFRVFRRSCPVRPASGRISPVYPDLAMAVCLANSLGKRRRLTASIVMVNTSLTLARPRSLT